MAETVLPGVSIEVRDEGLIIPLGVTVGNLGVVGTASKGPIGVPTLIGSYGEAREIFGDYDAWQGGSANELTRPPESGPSGGGRHPPRSSGARARCPGRD